VSAGKLLRRNSFDLIRPVSGRRRGGPVRWSRGGCAHGVLFVLVFMV